MTSIDADHCPNHHAHHRGFSGLSGILAALSMTLGRGGDASLATDLTGLAPGDRLLDLGCGPGAAVRFAARRGVPVIGVDPAPVMLDVARRLPRGGDVTYLQGAAEAIPLPDASVTVVWALATVHHWPVVEQGIQEVTRVLAPGGRFLAAERRTTPGASGLAGHGWTDAQADGFAALCRAAGLADVSVATHAGRRALVTVLSRRP